MIYKVRVLLDTDEDILRDIEIGGDQTLEDLYKAILRSFDWTPNQMAAFYMSNNAWEKGEEIPLADMSEGFGPKKVETMSELSIQDKLVEAGDKMLFVFDFFLMWVFYVELVEKYDAEEGKVYPNLAFKIGDAPNQHDKDPEELDFSGDDIEEDDEEA